MNSMPFFVNTTNLIPTGAESNAEITAMCSFPFPEAIEYGKVLYQHLEEPDQGYLQDIETTNYWAKILGLSDWFEWTDFEDVPESYGE